MIYLKTQLSRLWQFHPSLIVAKIASRCLVIYQPRIIIEQGASSSCLFIFNEKQSPLGYQLSAIPCIILAGQADFVIQFLCQITHSFIPEQKMYIFNILKINVPKTEYLFLFHLITQHLYIQYYFRGY